MRARCKLVSSSGGDGDACCSRAEATDPHCTAARQGKGQPALTQARAMRHPAMFMSLDLELN